MSFTAKSLILDIADAYTVSTFMSIRSIETKLFGVLNAIAIGDISATYCTQAEIVGYEISNAFVTSLSKTGSFSGGTSWLINTSSTNVRIIIVFVTAQEFDSLVVNNTHNLGAATVYGIKNTKITISDDVITDTTYNAAVSNSFVVFDGIIAEHVTLDQIDDQDLTLEEAPAPPKGIQAIRLNTDYVYFSSVLGKISESYYKTHVVQTGFGISEYFSFFSVIGASELFYVLSPFGKTVAFSIMSTVGELNKIFSLYSPMGFGEFFKVLPGMGAEDILKVLTPHGFVEVFSTLLQLSKPAEGIKFFLNEVRGKLEGVTSENVTAFVNSIALRDSVQGNQALPQKIVDGVQEVVAYLNLIADENSGISALVTEIRGRLEGVTSENISAVLNSITLRDPNQSNQAVINNIKDGAESVISLLNLIAEGAGASSALIGTLSSESFQRVQGIQTRILGPNAVEGMQYIIQSLKDLEATSYQAFSGIYLDGKKVDTSIGSNTVEISFSQDNIHNEISISSISEDLFIYGDPAIDPGIPRLEVHIGSRVLFFLIEQREGSSNSFTLWGRDQTARDNTPWSETTSVSLEEPALASDVVAGITGYSAVDWDIYDWMLPVGFESEGTPVDIISEIASEIGGVVRAQDDGSFLVRKTLTVRPVEMISAIPALTYLGDSIVGFSHNKSTGDHYNSVQVSTYSADIGSLDIELDDTEDGLVVGDTAVVKIYKTLYAPDIAKPFTTDGKISKIVGSDVGGTFKEEHTELVEFEEGIGETSYPINEILDIEWIGKVGSLQPDWDKYGKTLTLVNLASFRIAKITYTSLYDKYSVVDSDVESLLAVFSFVEDYNTDVIVKTQAIATDINGDVIDKEGSVISASNLTDKAGAVLRGESWIDQNKYDSYTHEFSSPYNDLVTDGAVVWLDCNRIGTSGNYYVTGYRITISGPKVYNSIEVVQWVI